MQVRYVKDLKDLVEQFTTPLTTKSAGYFEGFTLSIQEYFYGRNEKLTLLEALREYVRQLADNFKLKDDHELEMQHATELLYMICHRRDKDTGGLLKAALNEIVYDLYQQLTNPLTIVEYLSERNINYRGRNLSHYKFEVIKDILEPKGLLNQANFDALCHIRTATVSQSHVQNDVISVDYLHGVKKFHFAEPILDQAVFNYLIAHPHMSDENVYYKVPLVQALHARHPEKSPVAWLKILTEQYFDFAETEDAVLAIKKSQLFTKDVEAISCYIFRYETMRDFVYQLMQESAKPWQQLKIALMQKAFAHFELLYPEITHPKFVSLVEYSKIYYDAYKLDFPKTKHTLFSDPLPDVLTPADIATLKLTQ